MGKTCPTSSLNSSISNSVITSASINHNQSHNSSHQHQYSHQHQQQQQQQHQQHHHHSVPLPPPPPPPPQPLQPQQQQHFPQKYMNSKRKHANNYHNMLMHPGAHLDHNNYLHLNSLWSIWYGVLLTLFQGYLAVHGAYRFLGCSLISWKIEPVAELNLQIVLSGVVFILLPFFFTSAVFKVTSFLKEKALPIKALLLIDNAPSHPNEAELTTEDGQISAMFMPPNVTPLIQPMDQNAIKITKLHYRNSLLASIAATKSDLLESMKKINLKTAINLLEAAWFRVGEATLAKCWNSILNFAVSNDDPENNVPLAVLKEKWEAELCTLMSNTVDLLSSFNPEVGNLANDGIKLATGSKERRCSMSPHDGLEEEARGGTLRALWTHGGPTAASVHIVIAMCLLLPRLLLEARIIENGLLPRENIWQTELDFIAMNRRNLVVLSVVNAPYQNSTAHSASSSLYDDQEEDYYNDTMFTAVGDSGGTGTNINNNMLDTFSGSTQGKPAINLGNRKADGKRRKGNNVGVDFIDGGKTRYFEVPDLINRDSSEQPEKDDVASNGDGDDDDVDVSDVANHKDNNKYDFKEEADIYDGRGAEGGGGGDGVGGEGEAEGASEGRIFVEHFDTKEFWENKLVNMPQVTTAKATTTSTPTAKSDLGDSSHKNYDIMRDKLGTLSKTNSISAGVLDMDTVAAVTTTTTTTTTATEQSSTITSNMRASKTMPTTTANELDKAATSTDAATATTIASTTTTTAGRNTKYTTKTTQRTSTAKMTMSATASDTSDSGNNSNNNADKDVSVVASSTTTPATTAAHTQPTRTHNHHHHNHQHHREQPQPPQQAHTHATNSAKSARKHHGHNRQHHRQRGGQHHSRRQQSHSAAAGGRSDEAASSRPSRLDVGRAAADLRPSAAFAPNKIPAAADIDLNRLDDVDLSAGSTVEQSIISHRDSTVSVETDALDNSARRIHTKSTSTFSTTTRDSDIHIVKPEKLPEIIPSTPLTSNSKIIEIKTKSSGGGGGVGVKRSKRMAVEQLQVEIEPEYLVGELSGNDSSEYIAPASAEGAASSASSSSSSSTTNSVSTAPEQPPQTTLVRLDGFAGMLQIFFGIEKPIDMAVFEHPPSAEFVNLIFALLVWCVRYPAVFWTTTKSFATIFSIQMIAVALDVIFSYIGAANLYKLQVYSEAMPIQNPGLILNGVVTLALFLLSSVLMIASSMIMYLYGHGRLAAKMRDRSLITMKSSETWIYFAHCASLCYVLALAVVKAPLLNDLSATYQNNLHCPTFMSALISVAHLLLWIVIWLGLTAKRRWTFKLPPMDAYGITKATTQPLLMGNRSSLPSAGSVSGSGSNLGSSDQKGSPLLSGGGGGGGGGFSGSSSGRGGKLSTESSTDGGTDDVYWPKLTPSSPKLKVTFNEVPSTSDDVLLIGEHEQNDGKRHSPRGAAICFASVAGEIDDGEYATLRTASAATMAGINIASLSSSVVANKVNMGTIDPVMTIGCGNETHVGGMPNNNSTTPTGIHGMKLLHLCEYDELPPPPPQLIPNTAGEHSTSARSVYANSGGGGNGGNGANGAAGSGSFGDDSTSEEGKLLACVRDDSVTYASTRDPEPPAATTPPPPPPPGHTAVGVDGQLSSAASTRNNAAGVNGIKDVRMSGGSGGGGGGSGAAAAMTGRAPQAIPENMQLSSSPEHLVSPLAPVTVTVHTNEAHIASSSTPRCLRRADSGVPNEALTPRSDTASITESTTSPPERAPSESSSGVHSGEERDVEVIIRPRAACKPPPKPPQPAIQEEPYGRCTNMRMSSFGGDATTAGAGAGAGGGGRALNSATLPLTRSAPEQKFDYANHCSTMPLPTACHSPQSAAVTVRGSGNYGMTTSAYSMHAQPPLPPPPLHSGLSSFRSQYANSSVAMAGANAARMQQQQHEQQLQLLQQLQQQQQQYSQPQSTSPPPPPPPAGMHTTLPNGVRYSNPHFLRRLPHVTKAAESPYGHLGLGAGHHTFSKLLQDPLQNSLVNTAIPEDRDSANYSMSSENDCANLYATAQSYN